MSTSKRASGCVLGILTLALTLAPGLACQPASRRGFEDDRSSAPQSALHAIHSSTLRDYMKNLERETYTRMPQEMEDLSSRSASFDDIAEVAASMARTAGHIPDVLVEVELTAKQRALFVGLARKLEDQARMLEKNAQARRAREVRSAADEISATCNRCHSAFRVMPSAIDTPTFSAS